MSNEIAKVTDVLVQIETLITQTAPEVLESTIMAVQLSALNTIVGTMICILVIGILSKLSKKAIESVENEDDQRIFGIFRYIFGGLLLFAAVLPLIDMWLWIAIFNPKLAVIRQILGL